jgi:hypothetical protein
LKSACAALLHAAACALLAAGLTASADVALPPPDAPPDVLPPSLVPVTEPPAATRVRLVGAPFARYSPETSWGFGAGSLLWFHADPEAEAAGRVSAVGMSLERTLREQSDASAIWDVYLSGGQLRMSGALCDERWPNKLWGAGAAGGARAESYLARSAKAEAGLAALAADMGKGRGLWLGMQVRGRTDGLGSLEPGGLLDRCALTGCRGGAVFSLAATVAWDTRDQVFSAQRGLLLSARAGGAVSALDGPGGGVSNFTEAELDARAWLPLALPRGARLALQARLHATAGVVPFYVRPTFGGDHSLRGVFEGRWRDLTALSLQAEYAVPLFWRLGMGFFGGAGQVTPRPGGLAWERFVPAGGAGLRVTVDRADRVFVRLDRGYSPGFATWYAAIGEAI